LLLSRAAQGVAGPSFKLVRAHPLVRLSWRGQASLVFIAPLTCYEVFHRMSAAERAQLVSKERLVGFLAVGTTMFGVFMCWNFALTGSVATAFSHLVVFSQLHPAFIALWAAGRAALSSVGRLPRWLAADAATRAPPPWPRWSDWVGVAMSLGGVAVAGLHKFNPVYP
jgi:hypothetical protein